MRCYAVFFFSVSAISLDLFNTVFIPLELHNLRWKRNQKAANLKQEALHRSAGFWGVEICLTLLIPDSHPSSVLSSKQLRSGKLKKGKTDPLKGLGAHIGSYVSWINTLMTIILVALSWTKLPGLEVAATSLQPAQQTYLKFLLQRQTQKTKLPSATVLIKVRDWYHFFPEFMWCLEARELEERQVHLTRPRTGQFCCDFLSFHLLLSVLATSPLNVFVLWGSVI